MNQLREWTGRCQRCGEATDMHTMSIFDVTLICMDCHKLEASHPGYENARKAERESIDRGDYNYEGVGYPHTEIGNDPIDW